MQATLAPRRTISKRQAMQQRALPDALAGLLRQVAEFVSGISADDYDGQSPLSGGGSIGAHVRHSLDHVALLLQGIERGVVDYDQRQRGTNTERDPRAAFDKIGSLLSQLQNLSPNVADVPIRVRGLISPDSEPVEVESTVSRELLFVISHTIHHNAMIATTARRLGIALPDHFGYASATIAAGSSH